MRLGTVTEAGSTDRVERSRPLSGFLIAVFCLLTLSILVFGRATIQHTSIEGFDPATNSTLIQYAKHFQLALGNYSRIGFNHPGPAVLYILAAGEFLAYDVLHLVPSPIGGQIVAVAFYSAAWATLIVLTFSRIGFSRAQALLATSCLLAFVSLENPSTFTGVWFPRLYTMPFACFTVALAGILAGHRPSWLTAALAFGFLENGHVSFIGICAVMMSAAALWNGLQLVQNPFASRPSIKPHRWIIAAAMTTGIFFLPLAWREMRHHPGPIEQYAAFASVNTGAGLAAAEEFLAAQSGPGPWGKGAALVGVAILCALAASRPLRCVLGALGAAVIGTLYYAAKGIDDLNLSYTVIFFAAVPGLTIGAALSALCALTPPRAGIVLAGACTLLATSIWSKQVLSVGKIAEYDVPEIAKLEQAIRAQGPVPVALDLDTSGSGSQMTWTMMAGVQAYEMRREGHLSFCIREGWHILFTEAARCPDEEQGLRHFLVEPASVAAAGSPGGAGLAIVPVEK